MIRPIKSSMNGVLPLRLFRHNKRSKSKIPQLVNNKLGEIKYKLQKAQYKFQKVQ